MSVKNSSRRISSTDNYSTPGHAVQDLLDKIEFSGNFLEPFCGQGLVSEFLLSKGFEVFSSDLRPANEIWSGADRAGADFLDPCSYPNGSHANIVSNPPYSMALDCAKRALVVARDKVAFLLKLQFLETVERYEFFESPESPLRWVIIYSSRLSLYPEGDTREGSGGGVICYAWFVWEHGYTGSPMIAWVPPKKKSRRGKKL